jgi:hypothetical protein
MAMSRDMSPSTLIWPDMKACMPACWLPSMNIDLATSKGTVSLVGAPSARPRSNRPPAMWISLSPSGPPATTMLMTRSFMAAGGSGISSRSSSTASNQSSDRNTCGILISLSGVNCP